MSNLRKLFGTNKKKEEEGVWIAGPGDTRYLVARSDNPEAEKLAKELMRPYRKLVRMGQMPKEKQEEISLSVLSRTILRDWDGVKDESGKAIAYTPDAGFAELKASKDFAEFIATIANEAANYRDEEEEERRGNSSSASSGI